MGVSYGEADVIVEAGPPPAGMPGGEVPGNGTTATATDGEPPAKGRRGRKGKGGQPMAKLATEYRRFLATKSQVGEAAGFEPLWLPDALFPFQRSLVEWAIRKGRAALCADCGLGKSLMQLTWAENVVRKTNRPVLVLTPLAVGVQTVREAAKFGMEAARSPDGKVPAGARIVVANYERLAKFDPGDFAGVVCDEASILKHYTGATQKRATRFLSKVPYRLLCTATPAPNDYIEMGTLAEALGVLTYSDMLATFFRQLSDDEKKHRATADSILHSKRLSWRVLQSFGQWALKPHAFEPFWKWVASWARACRKPSDVGPFDDSAFTLPPLVRRDHVVTPKEPPEGWLFTMPAIGLNQERAERRRTIDERSALVRELVAPSDSSVIWCSLNDEADAIEAAVPGSVQVKGSQSVEEKEERIVAFLEGQAKHLVTKAKIAGLGLNLQHCAHVVTFVTHSYEGFYQSVRRCWRFGQKRPVTLDVIATDGEINVKRNMDRKEALAEQMFASVVRHMNDAIGVKRTNRAKKVEVPSWLSSIAS